MAKVTKKESPTYILELTEEEARDLFSALSYTVVASPVPRLLRDAGLD